MKQRARDKREMKGTEQRYGAYKGKEGTIFVLSETKKKER